MNLKLLLLILGPVAFVLMLCLPAPSLFTPEAWRVMAMTTWMLIWWISEATSLAVTALIPMICLPMLRVPGLNLEAAAVPYGDPIVFLFMGGFMIALAMEKWGLHRRIALNIVRLTGTDANGIILGFMLATAFMSMWISNTATTVMMLPIALSVINLLTENNSDYSPVQTRNFALCMMLGIAYAATLGGMATLVGTPPNLVFTGYMQKTFGYEVSFAKWMIFSFPIALFLILFGYFLMVKLLFPNRLGKFHNAAEVIENEVASLGKMSQGERRTLIIFILTALFWMFRAFISKILPGISDTGIALMAAISLFVIPMNREGLTALEWRDTEKLPWGILLLFGGGLSLANGLETTGIINIVGQQFAGDGGYGFWVMVALAAVTVFISEAMSNVALVTILLPVVGGVAVAAGINPIVLCIPVTLAASCGFMLPMATPPNAIAFASGHLRIADMVKAGWWLDLASIFVVALAAKLLLPLIF